MYRYAQIDENGIVVSDSHLSGEVHADNMIPIAEDFDLTNKKYENGEWVEYIPPQPEPEPSVEEILESIAINTEYLVALQELNGGGEEV